MSQFEILVNTSSTVVFDSFITDTRLSEWFCQDAQIEMRPEGRFYAYWSNPKFYVMGEILEFERPNRLKLQWNDLEGTNTSVEISFAAKDNTTLITVASEQALNEKAATIWIKGLQALKSTLEQGYRPEVFEDAVLGLLGVTALNADNAHLYTAHCQEGLFLQGILINSSLDLAGFKHGDVLTSFAEKPLKTIGDLIAVLNPLQVNDTLEVEFWRGAEQKKQLLTMQKRQVPAYPASLEDLATYRQQAQHQAQTNLEAFAKMVLESEAHFKINPKTWSAVEIVAHLINSERDTLTQIAYLQVGNSVRTFTTSLNTRIEALIKRYQTLPALIEALNQAQAETCDLIRHLTPDYLERKAHVTRIQFACDITAAHIEQHLGQIKRAVAKARA